MKVKILLVQKQLMAYRIPLIDYLKKHYEDNSISVAVHSDIKKKMWDKISFPILKLRVQKLGKLFRYRNIYEISLGFNVVIIPMDLYCIDTYILALNPFRNYSLIFWTIGVATESGFDVVKSRDWLRIFLAKKADKCIFYSDYPIAKYESNGVLRKKLFIAHNTISNTYKLSGNYVEKSTFLFVGSLEPRKKLDELIEAFTLTQRKFEKAILIIIGEGSEYERLSKKVKALNNIYLKGAIYNQSMIKSYYEEAIACISPGQAGLGVLQSFSFGIPYITKTNAITGGEIFNIKNEENGYRYDGNSNELASIMENLLLNPELANKMRNSAYNHYSKNRNIQVMATGFIKAINA